jgi:hypothetical protein
MDNIFTVSQQWQGILCIEMGNFGVGPDLGEHHNRQIHMYHDQEDLHQQMSQLMPVFLHM